MGRLEQGVAGSRFLAASEGVGVRFGSAKR